MEIHAHEVMRMMLELDTASEAMPDISMPELRAYPGGDERVQWHIKEGINTFEQF